MRTFAFLAFTFVVIEPALAVSLSQVIRDCGDDGKIFCKGVGYGQPMQDCLVAHKTSLKPACQTVVSRLQKGEKVRLLEW